MMFEWLNKKYTFLSSKTLKIKVYCGLDKELSKQQFEIIYSNTNLCLKVLLNRSLN